MSEKGPGYTISVSGDVGKQRITELEATNERLKRHNELLRELGNAAIKLYDFPYGVYGSSSPYWGIKENFDVKMRAATDAQALEESEGVETAVSQEVQK
jgi:hypothetical protein